MTEFYIPPQGLYFRILGYNESFGDQFFTLIHGTGKHAGYYAIQARLTNKVLYSRMAEPRVGHVDGNGMYDDNWFKLELGTGKHASNFRLRCDCSDTVIFSRTGMEPQVGNIRAGEVFDDQYFSFLFEDMKIDRVVYHIDDGKILSSTPIAIATQTLHNQSDNQQAMEFSLSETETHTSSFDYTLGFTITVGVSGKAGVPFVAEGGVKVDVANSNTFKWGSTTTTSKTYSAKLPVSAPARSTLRAVSSITRSTLNVPITVYSKSESSGFEVQTQGVYTGVTTWDLRHTVTVDGPTKVV